jgi:NADPH:quinone reductase-like Zn-dependent oxidoreductase
MKALVQIAYGDPARVLELQEHPECLADSKEVVVGVEAAVVQMADLHTVMGRAGFRKPLPRTPGYEGIGRILAVGAEVTHLRPGQRVFCPIGSGTHREQLTVNATGVTAAPEGDAEQIALLALNPAATLLMLQSQIVLDPGDWIVQNGAHSAVGQLVQQLAAELSLRVMNVVSSAEVAAELIEQGASAVVIDDSDMPRRVSTVTQGAEIRLGLDAVGGTATASIAGCLADGGTLIHHGAISGEPCVLPHDILTRGIRLIGFNPARQLASCPVERRKDLYRQLGDWVGTGRLRAKIAAALPLERVLEAYETARMLGDKRSGRVVIRFEGGMVGLSHDSVGVGPSPASVTA